MVWVLIWLMGPKSVKIPPRTVLSPLNWCGFNCSRWDWGGDGAIMRMVGDGRILVEGVVEDVALVVAVVVDDDDEPPSPPPGCLLA